jgi:hypothetical protein
MHEFRPFRLDSVNQYLWRQQGSADLQQTRGAQKPLVDFRLCQTTS